MNQKLLALIILVVLCSLTIVLGKTTKVNAPATEVNQKNNNINNKIINSSSNSSNNNNNNNKIVNNNSDNKKIINNHNKIDVNTKNPDNEHAKKKQPPPTFPPQRERYNLHTVINKLRYKKTVTGLKQDDLPEIGPGANGFKLSRPEGMRSFYVYFPKSYFESTANYPILFAYHGLGDTCEDFGPATNFSFYADNLPPPDKVDLKAQKRAESLHFSASANATSFIYVYPCATSGWIGTAWNAGTCCLQPTTVDDVGFTSAMISFTTLNFRVDTSRIFAAGFSNGAMMAEVLGCQLPWNFSAVASVSGIVEMEPGNNDGLAACDKSFIASGSQNHVSVLNIHGYEDTVVPWDGDSLLGFPPVPTNMERWATRNICTNKTISTFSNGPYSNTIWNDCNTKSSVDPADDSPTGLQIELVKNANGGHEWPIDHNFDTTTYILDFLFRSTASQSNINTREVKKS